MSDVSDKIAKILEDPESLKMISEIAENFTGSGVHGVSDNVEKSNSIVNTEQESNNGTSVPDNTDFSFLTSAIGKLMRSGDVENTVRLVTALKPYMSSRRRDSADSVLRILSIMKLAGNSDFQNMVRLLGKS